MLRAARRNCGVILTGINVIKTGGGGQKAAARQCPVTRRDGCLCISQNSLHKERSKGRENFAKQFIAFPPAHGEL
jgi:hypothetical protein